MLFECEDANDEQLSGGRSSMPVARVDLTEHSMQVFALRALSARLS